jgi:hypothetical protein
MTNDDVILCIYRVRKVEVKHRNDLSFCHQMKGM